MKNNGKTTGSNPIENQEHTTHFRSWVVTLILFLSIISFTNAQDSYKAKSGTKAYIAEIKEINPQLTADKVSGEAIFIVADGKLSITLALKGVAPNLMHLQHIHGFINNDAVTLPPATADTNEDGIIDLIETHEYRGVTLIPLNGAPVALEIKSDTYPVANTNGLLTYEMTIPLDKLKAAIKKTYGIDELELENRAIFIHGIPKGQALPDTVQSLPGVPSYITVPIACGIIKAL